MVYFTFTKVVKKLISTKNRIFVSLVRPSDSVKTYLIHEWLKVGTFQPKFNKYYFLYQHPQSLYDVMQKQIDGLEFVQGVQIELINSLKNNGTKFLLFLMTHVQKFVTLRSWWTLLPPADIADSVLYTLNITYFSRVN